MVSPFWCHLVCCWLALWPKHAHTMLLKCTDGWLCNSHLTLPSLLLVNEVSTVCKSDLWLSCREMIRVLGECATSSCWITGHTVLWGCHIFLLNHRSHSVGRVPHLSVESQVTQCWEGTTSFCWVTGHTVLGGYHIFLLSHRSHSVGRVPHLSVESQVTQCCEGATSFCWITSHAVLGGCATSFCWITGHCMKVVRKKQYLEYILAWVEPVLWIRKLIPYDKIFPGYTLAKQDWISPPQLLTLELFPWMYPG